MLFQKRKNDSPVISHFALLGSTCIKAAPKHVGEIEPSENECLRPLS